MRFNFTYKILFFLTFTSTFAFIFTSCEEPTTTPPPTINPSDTATVNTIELGVLWSDFNRIALKWTKSERDTEEVPFTYKLKRTDEYGNENVREYFLYGKDTTITDGEADTLVRGKIYRYKVTACDKEGKRADTSKTVTAQTLTATSHDFTWQIDTLGMPGDYLYDVWGYDTNNVWAVGYVRMDGEATGIAKWDGRKWSKFISFGLVKMGIYGFNENSIFVVGDDASGVLGGVGIWNGEEWEKFGYDYFYSRGDTVYVLNAVWGASEDDVWAVGQNGTIIHWNGSEWTKAESGTNANLTDIYGVSATEIYAVSPIVLIDGVWHYEGNTFKYDGESWKNIQSEIDESSGSLIGTQFYPNGYGVVVGKNVYIKDNSGWHLQTEPRYVCNKWGRVGGTNINDLIIVGKINFETSKMMHYNGSEWKTIKINGSETIPFFPYGVQMLGNKVFVVGESNYGATIYRGEMK